MDRFAAMEVFVKVVEAGNLSRAATQLGISNATVSTRLQQLEAHLGISLLHRTTRRFGVTEIGLEYYDQCKDILARIDTAEASLDQTVTGLSGSLRVDLPIAMGLFLSPLLVGFSNQHPNLAIRASLTNDVVNLVTNGIDVAVRMDEIDDLDLVARKFHNDPHALCASPEFLERCGKPDSPAELDLKQCYGLTRTATGNVRQWVFEQGDERYELEPQSNLVVNSTVTLIQSALQGVGFIYVPRILVTDHLASGKLVQCLGDWQTAVLKLFLVYPKTRFTAPKVREFVKYLTEFESHLQ